MTNVLLHVLAAIFLFLALWQLTGARGLSAFVAAVFAIHPLRVESVAWVAERKDVLSGVFFMLTLWAYAGHARTNRPSPGRYMMVVVLFTLGLMCKPTLVTLPFVLLLLDYWPLQRLAVRSSTLKIRRSAHDRPASRRGENPFSGTPLPKKPVGYLLVEKGPFFVLSAVSCVATLLAQEREMITLRQLTFGDRLANAAVSYVAYLGQLIWPAGLAVVYPFPQGGWNIIQTILAFLVLLIISVVFFTWRREFPFLLMGWLWFLGVLVPMIGIVQVGGQARADRYTYLAQIGLYVLLTWGAMELISKWRHGRAVLIALAVLIITGLTADSYVQTASWQNSETLWNQAVANTRDNHIAQNNLGTCLAKVGKTDEAQARFLEALRIEQDFPDAHYNLAILLLQLGRPGEAVNHLKEVLRLKPDDAEVRARLRQLGVER